MPEQVSRKEIDDYGRRNAEPDSYKNRTFGGKRIITDEYTGQKLYYSSKGISATQEQGRHYTTKTTANIDHVVPIDEMIKTYGNKISPEDLRRITNSDYNLAATSETLNKSKSNMSNHEYLYKKFREGSPENLKTTYSMLQKEAYAKIAISTDVTKTKITQAAGTAVNAGANAALLGITVSSVNNLVLVAQGEKSLDHALKDVAKDSGESFVAAAGIDLVQNAVSQIAQKFGNSPAKQLLVKDLPIAEISAMIMVGNSVVRFINDDITAEECATEIIMNGAGAIAYNLGMVTAGPVGAIVATLVVGQISKTVLEYQQFQKIHAQKEAQINALVRQALAEMEKQRLNLRSTIDAEYTKWDTAFDSGYEHICMSALENNVEGIAEGIDLILSIFNKTCRFHTREEFNAFFDDPDAVFTL